MRTQHSNLNRQKQYLLANANQWGQRAARVKDI